MSDLRGKLEDWSIINGALWGKIYGDTNGVFQDGEVIITSAIKVLDFENKRATTKNSTFELGAEHPVTKTIQVAEQSGTTL